MSLRHSVQGRVSDSTSGSVLCRRINAFTGMTTKKNTANEIVRNAIRKLMKSPYRKWLELMVNDRLEKFGFPKMSAMIGVRRSRTSAVTSAPKAAPMTTATARSTEARGPRSPRPGSAGN